MFQNEGLRHLHRERSRLAVRISGFSEAAAVANHLVGRSAGTPPRACFENLLETFWRDAPAEDLDTWNCTKMGHSGPRLPPVSPPLPPPPPLPKQRGGKGGIRWGKGTAEREHVTHPAEAGVNEPGFTGAQKMRCAQACPKLQQFLDTLSHLPTILFSR